MDVGVPSTKSLEASANNSTFEFDLNMDIELEGKKVPEESQLTTSNLNLFRSAAKKMQWTQISNKKHTLENDVMTTQ